MKARFGTRLILISVAIFLLLFSIVTRMFSKNSRKLKSRISARPDTGPSAGSW